MPEDQQHEATHELNEALAAGFAARNFDGLGPFYTEDVSLMPPRGRMLSGRAEVPAFWLGVANRFSSASFTTVALKQLGDAARRECGTYTMGTADGTRVDGRYVFVWQLVDGEWQVESAIWNRSPDPAGAGRQPGQGQGQRQGQGQGQRPGAAGQGAGQGQGRYRQAGGGGNGAGGYRQGGGRPSFQQGGAGVGGGGRQGGGGARPGGMGPGGGGRGPGAGRGPGGGQNQGQGQGGGYGGGSTYESQGGLYSGPKD